MDWLPSYRSFCKALLLAYPAEFREEYGAEMERLASDRASEPRLWTRLLADTVRNAPREHLHILLRDLKHSVRLFAKAPGFTATLGPTDLLVTAVANGVDLRPTLVSAPTSASPGQTITVSWRVLNQSPFSATGTWADSIYLSTTPALTSSSVLLGSQSESGGPNQDVGYNGSLRYHAAGSGADTATWQATGLPAGYDTVQATWNASSNHASNAPYSIYDGSTLLKTVLVNQQPAPSGDTTLGCVVFQNLATVHMTSGTLSVVLSDNANGYVVADAV